MTEQEAFFSGINKILKLIMNFMGIIVFIFVLAFFYTVFDLEGGCEPPMACNHNPKN